MNTMLCSVSGLQNKEGKGVHQVGVNLVTGSIQVKYNEPATEMELKNCIENTGFQIEYE